MMILEQIEKFLGGRHPLMVDPALKRRGLAESNLGAVVAASIKGESG